MKRLFVLFSFLGLAITLFSGAAYATAEREKALDGLLEEIWQFELRWNPLSATDYGEYQYNDKLDQVRPEQYDAALGTLKGFAKRLELLKADKWSRQQEVNIDLYEFFLDNRIAMIESNMHLMPISSIFGFHSSFAQLADMVPLNNVKDYEDYISRLNAFKAWVADHMALMRLGIAKKVVPPKVIMQGLDKEIAEQIVDDPKKHLLYKPFEDFPKSISSSQQRRLAKAGAQAIGESVVPGYEAFLMFMQQEYVPACRDTLGLSEIEGGEKIYAALVKKYTTLKLTPKQVHRKGLSEVKRIRKEMRAIRKKVGFKGDHAAFVKFLRTDPQFYAKTPEELMRRISFVLKKMDGKLPSLFGALPRSPYGIKKIPDFMAPKSTTAYYWPPRGDGSTAGFYYVNTYDLKSRPLFEVEALSLHEAVPGHHLQIALQQELKGLPKLRRFSGSTAFSEGWGLYSERLGLESGFYEDPYSDFGRLSYEMWRACRLVVDTGLHAFGWSRQKAIDFMLDNTALTKVNVTAEVDRYIGWPGQALAYKTGELKIRELRKKAEKELGRKFDVRQFHDAVLRNGAVTLPVLEKEIELYIRQKKSS